MILLYILILFFGQPCYAKSNPTVSLFYFLNNGDESVKNLIDNFKNKKSLNRYAELILIDQSIDFLDFQLLKEKKKNGNITYVKLPSSYSNEESLTVAKKLCHGYKHLKVNSIITNSFKKQLRKPRISIITSIYKGDQFIQHFLKDITQQTIFDQCELILINANSPDNEDSYILEYCKLYENILYIRLPHDPGIYGVWNLGIKIATSDYIVNANIDDRVVHNCYETYVNYLEQHPEIDLVYSDLIITTIPNLIPSPENVKRSTKYCTPEFSVKNLFTTCLPNDHPMWRKSCHERWGYFDESFKSAGDYEFWLRIACNGAQFAKVSDIYGFHYCNPVGLSTNNEKWREIHDETMRALNRWLPCFNKINKK